MGKTVENPRYNVLSLRLSDVELEVIRCAAGHRRHTDWCRELLIAESGDRLIAEQFGTGQPGGSRHVPLLRLYQE